MHPKWEPTQEILITIYDHARDGVREDAIARLIGLHPSTFSAKKKEFPILDETIKKARSYTEKEVVGYIMNIIRDPKHKSHATMLIFYAKTQLGWKDSVVVESTGKPDKPSSIGFSLVEKKESA